MLLRAYVGVKRARSKVCFSVNCTNACSVVAAARRTFRSLLPSSSNATGLYVQTKCSPHSTHLQRASMYTFLYERRGSLAPKYAMEKMSLQLQGRVQGICLPTRDESLNAKMTDQMMIVNEKKG